MIRDSEKSVITPDGEGLYCVVCKTRSRPGEEFYIFRNNKYIGRHPECIVKNPTPRPVETGPEILKRPAGSTQRRRSGGSGYHGGYGFHEI